MPTASPFIIQKGFEPHQRADAVRHFWAAFREKLNPILKPEACALQFLEAIANPDYAISAVTADGALLGVAGFKTENGAFMGGGFSALKDVYGGTGALWRGALLSLLERPCAPNVLLMDGIFVDESARGLGVGTALLAAIKAEARTQGLSQVRLDVIDTNPRARALYEREGFVAGGKQSTGPFRYLFSFRYATTMMCEV